MGPSYFLLSAHLLAYALVGTSGAAPDPLDAASAGVQALAVGASADTYRVPATLHSDFDGSQDLAELHSDLSSSSPSLESRSPLVRREAAQPSVIRAASSRRTDLGAEDDESESATGHNDKHLLEDPRFTPEALYSDQHIAPEIADFLGHLTQRARVHRKEAHRAAHEAGLVAQGRGRHTTAHDGENEDSDDIEDMKRAAAKRVKNTLLSHYFDQLDVKSKAASWLQSDCTALAENITNTYEKVSGHSGKTWGTSGPAGAAARSEIHTGMFFRHWGIGNMKEAGRKLRLSVLSFLATQDAAKVRLHIWTDLDKNDKIMTDMLGPIGHRPEFMDAITITKFDPTAEFNKVRPTLARETLNERYTKGAMPNSRSDLYRSIILYNYGGLWMDADTVLLKDVAPLRGEDWAHLVRGKDGAIEGALLSASKPRSLFTNDYLIAFVMREAPMDLEAAQQQKPILTELFNNDPARSTLHVLPPCFLDSDPLPPQPADTAAVLSSDASVGSVFFGKVAAEPYREFFSIGFQDAVKDKSTADVSVLQDPSISTQVAEFESGDGEEPSTDDPAAPNVWAYHWRGNFAAPWARGSLADVAERTFMKKLQLV